MTTAIITSLGTSVFAADTTVGTGNGIAYGTTTETSTSTSIAIGNTVKSSGQDSIGIGYDVTVDGFNSIAIGSSRNKPGVEDNPQKTIVTGTKNIGIGHKVEISNGYESVAIGSDARVYNIDKNDIYKDTSYSTVIGSSASSTGAEGTAYGRKSTANGNKATALGSWARANGENSAAIAYEAKANGEDSIAVGNNSEANGRYSTAIGRYAIADGEYSMTIGSNSHANNTNSIAIGNFAIANGENNIALGYNSSSTDVVKTSHASINGHDYKFAGSDPIGTLSIGGTIEVPVLDANGEPIMNEDYTAYLKTTKELQRTITNVAAGRISEESTDAVNGSQLHAVIKAVNEVAANDKDTITTVVAGANTAVTNDGNHNYTVSVNKDLNNMNSVNLNDTSGTKRARLDADKAHFFNDTTSTNTAVTANGVAIENTNNLDQANYGINGMTASGPNATVRFTTDGITAGNQIINGVKAGVADTDAVNVKQLKEYVSNNSTIVKAGDNIEVKADGNAYTVSTTKDLTGLNSINLNDGNNETNFNTKGIEMTYRGDGANGLEYHATYNYNGLTIKTNDGDANPVSEVSLTDKGLNNGGNRITNVGKGIDGSDGVNVKQLKDELAKNRAVESVITDNQIDNIAAVRVTNGKSTGEANAQYGVYVSKNTVTDIAKASNQFKGDSVIKVERTTGANHTADTTTFKFDGNEASKAIPISYKANGGAVNKVTAEKGFDFVDGNHIKASTDTNGVVRFDLDQEIPKQIERNTNNIEKITNRYDALTTKVAKNYKTAERGIAGTAALAALHPLDFDPDHKLDVMAGYGHFHGSNSVALGAAYRPNEDLMFTVGSTVGNGDTVVNAGVSYKVGAKSGVSRSKVAVAKDVADMKREMEAMKAQNAKITAILNAVLGADLPQDQNTVFPDVPENHWAFEAVDDLAKRGLIIGYEDGMFKGDRVLTRYEFAEVVHRAIQRAKEINAPIDGRLVDEFKPELLRFEVEQNGKLERVHALKSNKDIKRDSYGSIVK